MTIEQLREEEATLSYLHTLPMCQFCREPIESETYFQYNALCLCDECLAKCLHTNEAVMKIRVKEIENYGKGTRSIK